MEKEANLLIFVPSRNVMDPLKEILEHEPNPDCSQNLVDCSSSQALSTCQFHTNLTTRFVVS